MIKALGLTLCLNLVNDGRGTNQTRRLNVNKHGKAYVCVLVLLSELWSL